MVNFLQIVVKLKVLLFIAACLFSVQQVLSVPQSTADENVSNSSYKKKGFQNAFSKALEKDLVSAKKMAFDQLKKAKKTDQQSLADSYVNLGLVYHHEGRYDSALIHYNESVELYEELNNLGSVAAIELKLGIICHEQRDYLDALRHYYRALELSERLDNKKQKASVYVKIGRIYKSQDKLNEALNFYLKALEVQIESDDKKELAYTYHHIAIAYMEQGNYQRAVRFSKLSLKLKVYLGDQHGLAQSYNILGRVYLHLGKYDFALKYALKAYGIQKNIDDKREMAGSLLTMGDAYMYLGNDQKAVDKFNEAIKLSMMSGAEKTLYLGYGKLSEAYERLGEQGRAYKTYKLFVASKDSFLRHDKEKQFMELQSRFKFTEKNREIDLLKKENEIEKYRAQKKEVYTYFLGIGFSFILIIALLLYNRFRVKKRANDQLEQQNSEIKEKRELLVQKNKEITDSIRYAEHIQMAILPDDDLIEKCLPDSFILYKPKDIVSGDFYWVEAPLMGKTVESLAFREKGADLVLFAAVDCTGHGVPGAFMSIVGNNGLNAAVHERYYSKPSEILNYLNKHVNATLKQDIEKSIIKDGMDVALCTLRRKMGKIKVEFAGANNPLWVVSESKELKVISSHTEYKTTEFREIYLHEIRGDKHPVGSFLGEELKPFTNHEIELTKGDCLYVFSDGYADQFGGGEGKKFKQAKMKNLILGAYQMPMKQQKELLDNTIENWKGDFHQIDDMCIIGVRI